MTQAYRLAYPGMVKLLKDVIEQVKKKQMEADLEACVALGQAGFDSHHAILAVWVENHKK